MLTFDTRGVLDIHPCLKTHIWLLLADRHYRVVSIMLISKHDHSQPREVFILPSWILISRDSFLVERLCEIASLTEPTVANTYNLVAGGPCRAGGRVAEPPWRVRRLRHRCT